MNSLEHKAGRWVGTCAFRLLPTDELAAAPSSALSNVEAAGFGWSLRYDWTHPEDGLQTGMLLVGSPDEDGVVTGAWIDGWHQKPQLGVLTGTVVEGGVHVAMEYSGWGWTIEVVGDGDGLRLVMCNVVPAGVDGAEPGPYVVMDARWTPAGPAA